LLAKFVIVINPKNSSDSSTSLGSRPRSHGRTTLADVALHAGVTTMTVSRYLRSPQRVAASTASRIARAIQETSYSPNHQAGSLASGRSHVVAVIVPNIAHSIFADTLHGLGQELQLHGLHMLVSSTGYSLSQEEAQVRNVLGWAPAAVVVTGRIHLPATLSLLRHALARGTPVVEIWDQSPPNETAAFHQIGFNHFDTGTQMARALLSRGMRELVFIDSGISEDLRAHERADGFMSEALRQGVQAERMTAPIGDPTLAGAQCFSVWYSRTKRRRQVGFAFANDLLATGAQLQALEQGLRMPEDLLMLGFGDFPVGRYCQGGLSTIHIDGEQIGKACARHIARSLKPHEAQAADAVFSEQRFVPQLLWRGACALAKH
jgi:LacI family transcriptional regulator, gluconate utilization system Gnt-I transcriptional repressor